ncbi:MAG: hypothetical protein DSY33_00370 [Archaeoglobus sp.]|jgi:hypothetical protein|nr:MAG: hypothetical protein DSY33_00370 [Archaeoglobus sp.]
MRESCIKNKNEIDKYSNKEIVLSELFSKIISSIDGIARVVSCGEKTGETFEVYDPPYVLEICRDKIVLREYEDEIAILTSEGIAFSRGDEDIKVLEQWCVALTSMSFRRYIAKNTSKRAKNLKA